MSKEPSPTSPNALPSVEIARKTPSVPESVIALTFKPSDELKKALSRFIKPEMQERHPLTLKSDQIKRLAIIGGDENGWKHSRAGGEGHDSQSDVSWLESYEKKIKSIEAARIPTAAIPPLYELLADDSFTIELAFVPSLSVKLKIGQYLIRNFPEMTKEEAACEMEKGEYMQRLRVMNAHLVIPDSHLAKTSELQNASDYLMEKLDWNPETPLRVTPPRKRMYITQPYVTDQRVS